MRDVSRLAVRYRTGDCGGWGCCAKFSNCVQQPLVQFTAGSQEKLPQIVYWLMGSLASVKFDRLLLVLPAYLAALTLLFLYRWRINILSMGEQETQSMGVAVRRDRAVIILAATLVTALVVSISGIIGWVGIAHLAKQPYTNISGGERQLVLLAAALTQSPAFLILDEPTAHLDFGNAHRFLDLVLRLHAQGIGILMTTHFPDHALYLSAETLVLKDKPLWKHGGGGHRRGGHERTLRAARPHRSDRHAYGLRRRGYCVKFTF